MMEHTRGFYCGIERCCLISCGDYPGEGLSCFRIYQHSNSFGMYMVFSTDHQMKSPFHLSVFPVHRTSDIPMTSYLYRFISFLNNSSLPVAHSVQTSHVPNQIHPLISAVFPCYKV
jgi:hypothetical protein